MTSTSNFEILDGHNYIALQINVTDEPSMQTIMREWINRNHAERHITKRYIDRRDAEFARDDQFYDQHGIEHDEYWDRLDEKAKRPTADLASYRVQHPHTVQPDTTQAGAWMQWRTSYPARYEQTCIYHLVVAANARLIEKYQRFQTMLREIGYSQAAVDSVPLKSEEQKQKDDQYVQYLSEHYGE